MREIVQSLVKDLETLKKAKCYTKALHTLIFLASMISHETIRSKLEKEDFLFLCHAPALLMNELAKIDCSLTQEMFEQYCSIFVNSAHLCELQDLRMEMTELHHNKITTLKPSLCMETYQSYTQNTHLSSFYKEKLDYFNEQLADWVIERWENPDIVPHNSTMLTLLQRAHLQHLIQPYLGVHFSEYVNHADHKKWPDLVDYPIKLWQEQPSGWHQVLLFPVLFSILEKRLKVLTDENYIKQAYISISQFLFSLPSKYSHFVVQGANLLSQYCFKILSLDEITQCCESFSAYTHAEEISADQLLTENWTPDVYWHESYQKLNTAREMYYCVLKNSHLTPPSLSDAQRIYTQNLQELLQYLYDTAVNLLGEPPCEIALIGAGSAGRKDMSLYYSDLDAIILLGTERFFTDSFGIEKSDIKIISYLQTFCWIFNYLLCGMGENIGKSIESYKLLPHQHSNSTLFERLGLHIDPALSFLNSNYSLSEAYVLSSQEMLKRNIILPSLRKKTPHLLANNVATSLCFQSGWIAGSPSSTSLFETFMSNLESQLLDNTAANEQQQLIFESTLSHEPANWRTVISFGAFKRFEEWGYDPRSLSEFIFKDYQRSLNYTASVLGFSLGMSERQPLTILIQLEKQILQNIIPAVFPIGFIRLWQQALTEIIRLRNIWEYKVYHDKDLAKDIIGEAVYAFSPESPVDDKFKLSEHELQDLIFIWQTVIEPLRLCIEKHLKDIQQGKKFPEKWADIDILEPYFTLRNEVRGQTDYLASSSLIQILADYPDSNGWTPHFILLENAGWLPHYMAFRHQAASALTASEKEHHKNDILMLSLTDQNKSLILSPDIAKKLFDANGNPQKDPKYSSPNSQVIQLQFDNNASLTSLFVKFRHPKQKALMGREMAVEMLHHLLGGPSCVARGCPVIFLTPDTKGIKHTHWAWISEGIAGNTLAAIMDDSDKKIYLSKIDSESYSQLFLLALLTYPEDGQPGNFIIIPHPDGKSYRLVAIDNGHTFVSPTSTETSFLSSKTITHLNVKTMVYWLEDLTESTMTPVYLYQTLNRCVYERIRHLDVDDLMETWYQQISMINHWYEPLIKQFDKGNASDNQLIDLSKEVLESVRIHLKKLQSVLVESDTLPTHLEVLRRLDSVAANAIQSHIGKFPTSSAFKEIFPQSYSNIPGQSNRFYSVRTSQDIQQMTIKARQLASHMGLDEDYFLQIDFSNIINIRQEPDTERQRMILYMMQGINFKTLKLSSCTALTDGLLEAILKNMPDKKQLKIVHLDYCPNITTKSWEHLEKYCPDLKELYLQGNKQAIVLDKTWFNNGLKKLEILHAKESNITSGAMETILLSKLTLKVLDIDKISDFGLNQFPRLSIVHQITDEQEVIKILLLGCDSSGKSGLLYRIADNMFPEDYPATIGVDFKIKEFILDDKKYKLKIWDTNGHRVCRVITTSYLRGSDCLIICVDLTDRDSFDDIVYWSEKIPVYAASHIPIIIVGNKADLISEREVSYSELSDFAEKNGAKACFECSAKTGENVEELIMAAARFGSVFRMRENKNQIDTQLKEAQKQTKSITQKPQTEERVLKFWIIGSRRSGKTSLLSKYAYDRLDDETMDSRRDEFTTKEINLNHKNYKLKIWNTSGDVRFFLVSASFFRSGDCIIFAVDLTVPFVKEHQQIWYEAFERYAINMIIVLVGTKADLILERKVSFSELFDYAKEIGARACFECSTESGKNVKKIFMTATRISDDLYEKNEPVLESRYDFKSSTIISKQMKLDEICFEKINFSKIINSENMPDIERQKMVLRMMVGVDFVTLKLSYCTALTDELLEAILKNMPNKKKLQIVHLDHCPNITTKSWEHLEKYCHGLKELYLQGNKQGIVPDETSFHNGLKKLEILNVRESKITPGAMETIFLSKHTLKVLDLDNIHKFPNFRNQFPKLVPLIKVLLVGHTSSGGKSSLMLRFTDNTFSCPMVATLSVDFKSKEINLNGKNIKLEMWDMSGLPRSQELLTSCYRNKDCIVLGFDLASSFEEQDPMLWLDRIGRYASENTPVILIGNKCDLIIERKISSLDLQRFAKSIGAKACFECSTKTGKNVEAIFHTAARIALGVPYESGFEALTILSESTINIPTTSEEISSENISTEKNSGSDQSSLENITVNNEAIESGHLLRFFNQTQVKDVHYKEFILNDTDPYKNIGLTIFGFFSKRDQQSFACTSKDNQKFSPSTRNI